MKMPKATEHEPYARIHALLKQLQIGISLKFDSKSLQKFKAVRNPSRQIQTECTFMEPRSELLIFVQELYDGNIRLSDEGLCSAHFMEFCKDKTFWGSQNVPFDKMSNAERTAQICLSMRDYDK